MLEVRHIARQFPAVRALDGVSLSFEPGRVHGLIGENGAGKSTLMKILSGIETPDEGEILLDGKPMVFRNPGEAMAQGVVMIHQELNLIEPLTVAENIFLGREPLKGPGIDRARQSAAAADALKKVQAEFSPEDLVSSLSLANKQLVEIAKAISHEAKVLIMDEPTAVLSDKEIRSLFALIRDLRSQGIAVIYISHILKEVLEVCDDISVLRDGKHVASIAAGDADAAKLASLMVGRELGDVYPAKSALPDVAPLLNVADLQVPNLVEGISFSLRPGEILGLAGLIGAGRTETAEAIMGLRPCTGKVQVDGKPVSAKGPKEAVEAGIAYVSEDRKALGLHLTLSTTENATLANLAHYANPVVDRAQEKAAVEGWVQKLGIRVGDVDAPVGSLSGGNQQKVSLAKWLDTKPKSLILDEPTRGVDVGAKREIYQLVNGLAAEGMACLLISSEMTELIGLCHRIIVMRQGRIAGELSGTEMTEENIMRLAAGVGA